jgi:hypothetical protein
VKVFLVSPSEKVYLDKGLIKGGGSGRYPSLYQSLPVAHFEKIVPPQGDPEKVLRERPLLLFHLIPGDY